MSVATLDRASGKREAARRVGTVGETLAERLETVGQWTIRYGLVFVLLWIGAMKFTAYEAEAISGLVSHSPLMSWTYLVFSTRQFSALLGVVEISIAVLIAARAFSARLSAVGGALAVAMFATTLTFLLSTPGVIVESLGFPALSVLPGQFLVKDVVLLGAALWSTGEALRAAKQDAAFKSAALHGYDPVAYFTVNKPTKGSVRFASEFQGVKYYFASQEHQEQFDRNPEKYLPQYGGYCAFGVAMGQRFDIDPKTGQVIDGKLYFNLNKKILADFNKDANGYIEKADKNWPHVLAKASE